MKPISSQWIRKVFGVFSVSNFSAVPAYSVWQQYYSEFRAWYFGFPQELGYTPSAPAKLYTDNQSAMSVAKNLEHHGHIKHLDLCYYQLRDQVAIKKIQPLYLKTEDMLADLLTKPLAKPQMEKL